MSGFTAEGTEMSKIGQHFWSQAFRKRTLQNKTGEVGRDVHNIDFYPQQYKTSKVFSKELTIVFHLMPSGDWRVSGRRQGEQLGRWSCLLAGSLSSYPCGPLYRRLGCLYNAVVALS